LRRWGPSHETAFRAARLHAYSLARLAGWREHAPRFAKGPIDFAALFLPARSRAWHGEEAARAALVPTMHALGDILHRPDGFRFVMENVDFELRLGIVIVGVRPALEEVKP
jgi:hypothetical protein